MGQAPDVRPMDWIHIAGHACRGVVCGLVNGDSGVRIEVVYLDERDRAISEYVVWRDDGWMWDEDGAHGTYADGNVRLQRFVDCLRTGPLPR